MWIDSYEHPDDIWNPVHDLRPYVWHYQGAHAIYSMSQIKAVCLVICLLWSYITFVTN